jgi:hypothetical protein
MSQSLFCSKILKPRKNDRRICPISNDLTSAYTWATPQNALFTGRSS